MSAASLRPSSPRPYGVRPSGFTLPDATYVGAVQLQVADLSRSLDYYEHILGLRVIERDGRSAVLGSHGGRALVRLHAKAGIHPVPQQGAFGLYHFAILLPDRMHLGRFLTHLSRVNTGRLGMADHLVSEALYLTDPDGLGIEVYADRPRESWRHENRELVMATDPLDAPSVMAAGGRESWTGMPDGTTMGHMHLHVGDIATAEAFYHEGLGLEKMVWSYPGALFLAAGGYHHHLGVNTWSRGPAARDDQARLLEWELIVPDADAAEAAARSLQATGASSEDTGAGWRVVDPWGTQFRLSASA
ncbi:MAG: VOC family protein [Acidobacteriota bacterium]